MEATIARAQSSRQNSADLTPEKEDLSPEDPKSWPVSHEPVPQLQVHTGDNAWTEVMDLRLRGWGVADIIGVLEDGETFFQEWLESMGSQCVPVTPAFPAASLPAAHGGVRRDLRVGGAFVRACGLYGEC